MEMAAVLVVLLCLMTVVPSVRGGDVTYDGRSLIVNGSRRILFSGSIHYPRSTPQMWPSLIAKAKRGGLDVIQTYVFWNVHEPQEGQFNFHGRYDLVRFIKEVQAQGLYVNLRIGPFIESEWKYGGFPFWLHDVPGIVYRSDNEPFKFYMEKFTTKIVEMMKAEKLYASQGGPIILSQIENEYQNVEPAFHERGPPYVRWAAAMAVGLKTGVPWVMCKQTDAPDPVINACNGMNCGETFTGPNSPNKPSIWTENWTSQYQVFGGEPYIRSAEEIAFSVALFIAKKGSFVNYYMYHGGTNFDRSASAYVTTSYYDQAPLDEYGMLNQPKWGHLKELHAVIKGFSQTLLQGSYTSTPLGRLQEANVYWEDSGKCVAFLSNTDPVHSANVQFQNHSYHLPKRTLLILADCKNVAYNTGKVTAQYGSRSTITVETFDHPQNWEVFTEGIPNTEKDTFIEKGLQEHMNLTKDETDYLWYSVSYEHAPTGEDDKPVLQVGSLGHVVHAFVNDVYAGSAHGSHANQGASLWIPISLKDGKNHISLLSVLVGSPDSGAYMEKRVTGLRRVRIYLRANSHKDLSNGHWGYHIGLLGEKLRIYSEEGSNSVEWSNLSGSLQPLVWYKTTFNAPVGDDPVVLNLGSMGKGEAWVNGENIGRYWVSFRTPKGQPSQSLYHIPRSFLKPSGNWLVLFEEEGGDPLKVSLETVSISTVCGVISDDHYPESMFSHRRRLPRLKLHCPRPKTISAIQFASYGNPAGGCGNFTTGFCHFGGSRAIVEQACLGRRSCSVVAAAEEFGEDPCPGISKSLLVVASCQ